MEHISSCRNLKDKLTVLITLCFCNDPIFLQPHAFPPPEAVNTALVFYLTALYWLIDNPCDITILFRLCPFHSHRIISLNLFSSFYVNNGRDIAVFSDKKDCMKASRDRQL